MLMKFTPFCKYFCMSVCALRTHCCMLVNGKSICKIWLHGIFNVSLKLSGNGCFVIITATTTKYKKQKCILLNKQVLGNCYYTHFRSLVTHLYICNQQCFLCVARVVFLLNKLGMGVAHLSTSTSLIHWAISSTRSLP